MLHFEIFGATLFFARMHYGYFLGCEYTFVFLIFVQKYWKCNRVCDVYFRTVIQHH